MNYPKITIKNNRIQSIKRFHPWVFSGAIKKKPEDIQEGDIVELIDESGNFLAIGHYQPDTISVRILSFEKRPINKDFLTEKIKIAYNLRKALITNSNVFRLIHGEGDGLPGLVVDYYNGVVVVQCHSAGMIKMLESITEAILDVLKNDVKAIYNKSFATLPPKFENKIEDAFLYNSFHNPVEVNENGFKFFIDYINGQKTGFYIDQRENRKLLLQYAKNKVVANLFGYTGAFSVYAAKAGAKKIFNVDSSSKALDIAKYNYQLNGVADVVENIEADVFEFLKNSSIDFDVVIVDPPAFSKHHLHKQNALMAYKRLNALAIRHIKSNGILFSFSCSQAINANELRQSIFVAAASEKRVLKILHQLHQPSDHPVSIFHPEGEYLKGFVFHVE